MAERGTTPIGSMSESSLQAFVRQAQLLLAQRELGGNQQFQTALTPGSAPGGTATHVHKRQEESASSHPGSLGDAKPSAVSSTDHTPSAQSLSAPSVPPQEGAGVATLPSTSHGESDADSKQNSEAIDSDSHATAGKRKKAASSGRRKKKGKNAPDSSDQPQDEDDVEARRAYYRRNAARARQRYKENVGQLRSSIENLAADTTKLRQENKNLLDRIASLKAEQSDIKSFGTVLKNKLPSEPVAATGSAQNAQAVPSPQNVQVATVPSAQVPAFQNTLPSVHQLQQFAQPQQAPPAQAQVPLAGILPQQDASIILSLLQAQAAGSVRSAAPAPVLSTFIPPPAPASHQGALPGPVQPSAEGLQTLFAVASTLKSLGVAGEVNEILVQLLALPEVTRNPNAVLQPLLQAVLQSKGLGGSFG